LNPLPDKALVWSVATAVALSMPGVTLAQGATTTVGASATQRTAPAQTAAEITPLRQEELEQLLAPIALYRDALVAQVLMDSTYPLEIVHASRWRPCVRSPSPTNVIV